MYLWPTYFPWISFNILNMLFCIIFNCNFAMFYFCNFWTNKRKRKNHTFFGYSNISRDEWYCCCCCIHEKKLHSGQSTEFSFPPYFILLSFLKHFKCFCTHIVIPFLIFCAFFDRT
jgi:hypothetical protein